MSKMVKEKKIEYYMNTNSALQHRNSSWSTRMFTKHRPRIREITIVSLDVWFLALKNNQTKISSTILDNY